MGRRVSAGEILWPMCRGIPNSCVGVSVNLRQIESRLERNLHFALSNSVKFGISRRRYSPKTLHTGLIVAKGSGVRFG
jgi:hypothetical protein